MAVGSKRSKLIWGATAFAGAALLVTIFQNCGGFGVGTGESVNSSSLLAGMRADNQPTGTTAPLYPSIDQSSAKTMIPVPIAEMNPGGLPTGFFYAPAIIRQGGQFHMFYCGTGVANGSWDVVRYRVSLDGRTWTNEKIVLGAANGTTSTDRSNCDPSLVKFQAPGDSRPYYYLYVTGNERESYCDDPAARGYNKPTKVNCGQSAIFVARAEAIDGPYRKYTGNGVWADWSLGTDAEALSSLRAVNPQPVLRRSEYGRDVFWAHSYGAGQQAVVVRGSKLMMWYLDDSGMGPASGKTMFTTSTDGLNWQTPVETNLKGRSSADVKWDPTTSQFVMTAIMAKTAAGWGDGNHVDGSTIVELRSSDGLTWSGAIRKPCI